MRGVEASGKNVEEAVRQTLDELGVGPEKVEIDIPDGGFEPLADARVRVRVSGGDQTTEQEAQSRLPQDERGQSQSES